MSRTRCTVALIDDDPSIRRAVGRLLRSMGLEVAVFETAEDFLESPGQPVPNCLVLDGPLPGLSGLELQSALPSRAAGEAAAAPSAAPAATTPPRLATSVGQSDPSDHTVETSATTAPP